MTYALMRFLDWLCEKTGHLIRTEYLEKSDGAYKHCQICGKLIKKEGV